MKCASAYHSACRPPRISRAMSLMWVLFLKTDRRTGNWFSVPVNDWARHTLVAGVSGSGKTNTCKSILYQIWHDHKIPWLVLEPAIKSEYRTMIQSSIGADVRVFTLGDETGVPFRLNPTGSFAGRSCSDAH